MVVLCPDYPFIDSLKGNFFSRGCFTVSVKQTILHYESILPQLRIHFYLGSALSVLQLQNNVTLVGFDQLRHGFSAPAQLSTKAYTAGMHYGEAPSRLAFSIPARFGDSESASVLYNTSKSHEVGR